MKTYYCKKIRSNIVIDGNLDKTEWSRALGVDLVDNVSGDTPKQGTTVKLMWNDAYLYAAFSCRDDYINAAMTGYNDKLYNEEVVEIFLDDDRDLKTYIEIEVNPLNALLHYVVHNDLQGRIISFARTEKKVLTAVNHRKEEKIWNVEMAIPFSEFFTAPNIPPKPGDKWLMNLYRIDRPKDSNDEYTAWCPTGLINYHRPRCFGELIFLER